MNNLLEENNNINKKIKSLNNEKVKNTVFKKKNIINSSIRIQKINNKSTNE